jgi:hypothetical protein
MWQYSYNMALLWLHATLETQASHFEPQSDHSDWKVPLKILADKKQGKWERVRNPLLEKEARK